MPKFNWSLERFCAVSEAADYIYNVSTKWSVNPSLSSQEQQLDWSNSLPTAQKFAPLAAGASTPLTKISTRKIAAGPVCRSKLIFGRRRRP